MGEYGFAFNIAEGFGRRCREAVPAAVCELMGVPYTGSDALTLADHARQSDDPAGGFAGRPRRAASWSETVEDECAFSPRCHTRCW